MKRHVLLFLLTCIGFHLLAQNIPSEPIVYQIPEMSKVQVKQNIVFKKVNDTSLTLDVYYPPDFTYKTTLPVVIFNNGVGSLTIPQWRVYKDWGRLMAAKGMIAINYQARQDNGLEDGDALLEYVHQRGTSMNIDTGKIALWTCSANARVGTRLAMQPERTYIKSLVVYYGVIDSLGKLRQDLPVLVVRCGLDAQFLNTSIENFVQAALVQDARIELVNYLKGTHAFDVVVNTDESRAIIDKTITFFKENFDHSFATPNEFVLTNRNFMWLITHGQSEKALAEFRKARKMYRSDSTFNPFWNAVIREDVLNANAYWLMQHSYLQEALEAFKLMVETYPESANAYDGLGDAYEASGNKAEAVKAAQTCLQKLNNATDMDPQFNERVRQSAQDKLKRLRH
jgi:tetratricopeptide (TPR) repeat protein